MRRIVAMLLLVSGLAACGPSHHSPLPSASGLGTSAAPSGSEPGDLTSFVSCLHKHSVNVLVPARGTDLEQWMKQQAQQLPSWDAASQQCQNLLPTSARGGNALSDQDLEQIRAFAVCMRAHGVQISDPQTSGDRRGNTTLSGRLEHASRAQIANDPGYTAAMAACQDRLPNNPQVGNSDK